MSSIIYHNQCIPRFAVQKNIKRVAKVRQKKLLFWIPWANNHNFILQKELL
ncbi:hypothetical protein HC081234_13920 [Helicobacter cinaedi]|nr:hypothetical protein HC081234_13920 [Helicobacter cinaedi]